MIEIFGKQDDKKFKEWLKNNQSGFYLNKRPKNEVMLHKVGCSHLGDGEGMNSTTNQKVAANNVRELLDWANENGKEIKPCDNKECIDTYIHRN